MFIPQAPTAWSQGQSHGLPAVVPAGSPGQVVSNVVATLGQSRGAVGLISSQAGQLTVTRYADGAGLVPLPAGIPNPVTVAIVAATAISVSWADDTPAGSIQVTVTNTNGSVAANLTNVTVNIQP